MKPECVVRECGSCEKETPKQQTQKLICKDAPCEEGSSAGRFYNSTGSDAFRYSDPDRRADPPAGKARVDRNVIQRASPCFPHDHPSAFEHPDSYFAGYFKVSNRKRNATLPKALSSFALWGGIPTP
jgi:hypothetical protein